MKADARPEHEDFPAEWERDHYVTRRELTRFLTLASGLLAGASTIVAVVGRFFRPNLATAPQLILGATALPPGGSLMFRYPSDDDPCILVRNSDGAFKAYSQVCTHLSCAVVCQPGGDSLLCPCHHGYFSAVDGAPTAGPPTRRLPQILLERRGGELHAVGRKV